MTMSDRAPRCGPWPFTLWETGTRLESNHTWQGARQSGRSALRSVAWVCRSLVTMHWMAGLPRRRRAQ
jgi:hypothetical protein